ncbi:peptidoglycan D,D-transpeptidase FtsI family protein [Nocardioides lianchengensis]|uniref:Cell division protein FtsI (Penicillin-binding protein 3) n=1 Tax=Nocardioides lianchengensis TaxID=1045774 RepID=A0A1G6QT04_9ACTN|nr:penicillin-binding protein 2 [Nocardioides lianchengensis]NYG10499.1 cell division protein FtsI (penicillin-binding protein 3) [Nocardioides lianchengensis]SDC95539.1 cell division protein FtsI (penicillin-binding protein 3) [Nocardioides lianchengensis]
MSRDRQPATRRGNLRGSPQLRLRIGFVLIAMVLSAFGARLVQLQGLDPNGYAAMAAAEGLKTVDLPAERGEILDRNGEPLADSVDGAMVVADPTLTAKDAPALAKFLANRLDVDYFTILPRLRGQREKGSRFEYIARQVPAAQATAVVEAAEEEGYDGLRTERDPVRTYPNDDVAANLIGFVGTPDAAGRDRPLAGMELAFNQLLSGKDGEASYQRGAGSKIPLGESTNVPAVDGQDITTTIDRDLQWYTQRVLRQTVKSSGGSSGYAIVMDSRTGELLTVADYPTFNANKPAESPKSNRISRALSDPYEPGSVQKVLSLSALLDTGRVTPRLRLTVPGSLDRQDRPIGDWFDHGTIRLTLAGVLAKSSNIGTVLATDQFQDGELRAYLERFGLGAKTGIGVLGETPGILPSPGAWTSQAEDRISFGQSISVNAVQMAAAVNTIANGGVRVDPNIIKGSATMADGTVVGTDTAKKERVVSERAAEQTARMMERVLDPEDGVAPGAAVPGYRVAGKTGTAQRVAEECGCYDGSTTVSFGGFAPADDPRFTVYVVVQDPAKGSGGGSVGGPAFSKIMGYALRRYGVAPTGTEPSKLPVEW